MAPQTDPLRPMLVVGNWKMNGSLDANRQLLQVIGAGWSSVDIEGAICPAFVHIMQAAEMLDGSTLAVGAQTLNANGEGAYTGEVSAAMLIDLGCRYVIVGHNERRRLQAESDEWVAKQFVAATEAGLTPVLCVGESEQAREAGQTLEVIARQLQAVIAAAGSEVFARAVVAYEPIWAVGTGKSASPQEAEEVHAFIRTLFGEVGKKLQILYGGSVKPDNAASLFAMPNIDGALLGGASLNGEDFLAICRCAQQAR
ncbi:MAG TPA: triose-phosphate isomerase [Cellvibrionaceae bacterium]